MKLAHITYINDIRYEQTLKEHCFNTAIYAAASLEDIGFNNIAYLAGLLHDMGKGTDTFNEYLDKATSGGDVKRGSVNHTFAGVIYILEKYHKGKDLSQVACSEIIAYAIGAHHGLFDCVSLDDKNGFIYRLDKDKREIFYQEAVEYFLNEIADENEIDKLFRKAMKEFSDFWDKMSGQQMPNEEKVMMIGFLSRLLLSSVISADRKDTRQFMMQKLDIKYDINWSIEEKHLEEEILQYPKDSELNLVRSNISEQCAEKAREKNGIYRLNVPTGGGKTLSSLRYSVIHSAANQKKRIFFVIPLLSILDQNAQVIKKNISNPDCILEHHSDVINASADDVNRDSTKLAEYEIMTSNWNNPIVITTLVQLLNTMFSDKTSEIGRFRALVNSTIVIDEVQTLPTKTIMMFNRMLNFLKIFCNTTIVLSSATQPALNHVEWPVYYADEPELVKLNESQMKAFERTKIIVYNYPSGMEVNEIAAFGNSLLEKRRAILIICNTKTEARQIFKQLKTDVEDQACRLFHLSTNMCKSHRMNVLKQINDCLAHIQKNYENGEKRIICVSTQLVEAGIDFSFDTVIRIKAGIDNLAQAAGRCNRSNEYPGMGLVYLIKLKAENLQSLPDITCAKNATRNVLTNIGEDDLLSEEAIEWFYRCKFNECRKELKYSVVEGSCKLNLAEALIRCPYIYKKENRQYVLQQPFKYIGEKFSVFDNNTTDIIVPYENGKDIISELRKLSNLHSPHITIESVTNLIHKAGAFSVSMFNAQRFIDTGWIEELFDGRILVLSESVYDKELGISEDAIKDIDTFMF